jgi:hypothetical protein
LRLFRNREAPSCEERCWSHLRDKESSAYIQNARLKQKPHPLAPSSICLLKTGYVVIPTVMKKINTPRSD